MRRDRVQLELLVAGRRFDRDICHRESRAEDQQRAQRRIERRGGIRIIDQLAARAWRIAARQHHLARDQALAARQLELKGSIVLKIAQHLDARASTLELHQRGSGVDRLRE